MKYIRKLTERERALKVLRTGAMLKRFFKEFEVQSATKEGSHLKVTVKRKESDHDNTSKALQRKVSRG